jgi:hypothetical protein
MDFINNLRLPAIQMQNCAVVADLNSNPEDGGRWAYERQEELRFANFVIDPGLSSNIAFLRLGALHWVEMAK